MKKLFTAVVALSFVTLACNSTETPAPSPTWTLAATQPPVGASTADHAQDLLGPTTTPLQVTVPTSANTATLAATSGPAASATASDTATITLTPSKTFTASKTLRPTKTPTLTRTPRPTLSDAQKTALARPTFTKTSPPVPTAVPLPTQPPADNGGGGSNCDPAYPGVCIPPPPPDLDCGDVNFKNFQVLPPDPHHFDRDHDGIGCES